MDDEEEKECFEEKTVKNNTKYRGKKYFVNIENSKSQWGVPLISGETLPFGWEKHMSNKFKPYYENIKTGKTQWEKPDILQEELPKINKAWKMQKSKKCGTIYYKHTKTDETKWDVPLDMFGGGTPTPPKSSNPATSVLSKPATPPSWNIYTIKGCDLCKKSKDLLKSHNIEYYTQEITDIKKFQDDMKYIIGDYKYFPIILKDLKFIGGHQELVNFFFKTVNIIPPVESTTTYRGTPWQEIASLIYLLHKYPKECIVIPLEVLSPFGRKLSEHGKNVKLWVQSSIQWNEDIQNFIIPNGFWISVRKCLRKKSNLVVIPMGFTCKSGPNHTNFLIYDSKTKELERFEPNGFIPGNCFNPPNLEEKLKILFNTNVEHMVNKVYGPLEFCPKESFQFLQSMEFDQKKPEDPVGFCAAWAVWYADTRFANPNKTRKEVVDMSLSKLQSEPKSMTKFIRSYSAFLVKVGQLLKESKDPFYDILTSLIQKYT